MSNVTKKDLYVLKFLREDPDLANDQDALCAKILESEGFWKAPNLLTALRSCTSVDSIKRSHRALRENGYITVEKKIAKKNLRQMEKIRDERGNANIHAIKNSLEKGHIFSKTEEELFEGFPKVEIKGDTAYIVEKPNTTLYQAKIAARQMSEVAKEMPSLQTSMFGDRK